MEFKGFLIFFKSNLKQDVCCLTKFENRKASHGNQTLLKEEKNSTKLFHRANFFSSENLRISASVNKVKLNL